MTETNDLSITRLIDAPVDVAWSVATERLAEWWCPKPWTTEIVEMDWRPGGRSAMVMHGPAGEAHAQEGVFLEVVPGKRFVFTDAYAVAWVPQGPFMTGIFDFADESGKTRYTATARHWSAEAKAQHEAMGFTPGWGAVAEQLAALVESEAKG